MRRKPYQRATNPRPIRLTNRDIQILEAIHAYDGILSLKQIDSLFFSGKGRSQPKDRMRLLFDHGYVQRPSKETAHRVPYGEMVYWLDSKGAEVVASQRGEYLENYVWKRNPRYSMIKHDLTVNDFRLAIQQTIVLDKNLQLGEWITEGFLASDPDYILYTDRNGKKKKRQIRPDGFFTIHCKGYANPFAFFLEIDMGTEDNPRFAREKIWPGVAYLKSDTFFKRFGIRHVRWLVVTTGEKRCANMKATAERSNGKGYFYFSTFDAIASSPTSVLTDLIWYLAGEKAQRELIPISPILNFHLILVRMLSSDEYFA